MKKKWIILSTVLGLSALFLVVYVSITPSEIVWKGKPARYWIARLNFFDLQVPVSSSAEEFLFEAGSGVVPELIRGLGLHDRWLSDQWAELYFKLGKWQRYFSLPVKRSSYRANCARGLGLIGPAASNAVPALLKSLQDDDAWVRAAAAESLGRIGANQMQVMKDLELGLSSTNSNYSLACLIGLTHCAPTNASWGKILQKLLRDPDSNTRALAAESLWRDSFDCQASLAALIHALSDSNATVRDRTAQSLGKMHCDEAASVDALLAALQNELRVGGNEITQWKMISSLGQLGTAASKAIPLLVALSASTNHPGVLAVIALSHIEPQNPRWVDALIGQLGQEEDGAAFWAAWELGKHGQSAKAAIAPLRKLAATTKDWRTQAMAATSAWRLDPSTPNPLPLMIDHLSRRESGQYEFVRLIGELGPSAREAVPILRQLRYSRGIMMHDYAEDALAAVAPEYIRDPWRK